MPEKKPVSPHPNGSRAIALSFATIGFLIAFMYLIVTLDGPDMNYWPIAIWGSDNSHADPRYKFSVFFFSHEIRTFNSNNRADFDTEVELWHWIPRIVFVIAGIILGWFAGRVVAYRLLRPRPRL